MSSFNATDAQNVETTSHMYFLQIDPNVAELPLESQAVPLNMIINNHHEGFLIPIVKGDQQVVIDSAIDNQNLLDYINNFKYDSHNLSANIQTFTNAESTSSKYLNEFQVATKSSEDEVVVGTRKQNKLNRLSNISTENVLTQGGIKKIQGFVHLSDRNAPPKAVAVLPAALNVRRDVVSPRRSLPPKIRFGPVQGVNHSISRQTSNEIAMKAAASKMPIFLMDSKDCITHIDVSDKDKANWFSLLPLGDQTTANVWLYEDDGELYGVTVQSISSRVPLALGYSKQYADDHGLPPGQPVLDLSEGLPETPRSWWCYECERALPSAALLQRHSDVCHKDNIPRRSRRRYRCNNCTHTFSRLFTLRRHIARYCCKKTENIDQTNKKDTIPEVGLKTTLNIEDNRLPSDESLQNYTNGLDFSTNLFDTDRIPGLDISGSSRSEHDFNPYSDPYRDESESTGNILSKNFNDSDKSNEIKVQTEKHKEDMKSMLISCQYCNQTIIREKKQQHLRECQERRIKCVCGQVFLTREKLAHHIQTCHTSSPKTETNTTADNSNEYKCEKCPQTFKRRGMLVNHLWRVHQTCLVAVPLQRRVRHYPCVACHKLYRAADKRDKHVRAHHPDVSLVKGGAIESGVRTCEPAACWACPRQYATRAKLFQHVRAAHPKLALPLKKTVKSKSVSQNAAYLSRTEQLMSDI